jgi:hypothetical protein
MRRKVWRKKAAKLGITSPQELGALRKEKIRRERELESIDVKNVVGGFIKRKPVDIVAVKVVKPHAFN